MDWWKNITDKVLTLLYVVDRWKNINLLTKSDINLFCGLTEKYQTSIHSIRTSSVILFHQSTT
jgi:hypothetical protein